ncbi:MAG: enoyl-CoA hydratase-related protein [Pseudomonadota bacterium]
MTRRIEEGVGYVTLDAPPSNVLDQAMRQGLLEAVAWAEAARLGRVILSGAGGTFAAGEIAQDAAPPEPPHLADVLDAIERSAVPWIAVIEGVAQGGGAELALACRMRIMAPAARIGLPEVMFGLIPEAGGTQRLPRLVGLGPALAMISLGEPISAEAARAAKLVHDIDDDPAEAAFLVNAEQLGDVVPVWELPPPAADAEVLAAARETAGERSPGQQAPLRAIDVVEAGLALSFEAAMGEERRVAQALRRSDQARALHHLQVAEQGAEQGAETAGAPDNVVGDRILARYREAADTVFMDGSTPWEVDEAMVAFGYVMGPYEAEDLSGLDIAHAQRRREDATRDPNRRYIPIADRMIELGKLGRKTAAGWYRYPGGAGKVEDPIVADLAVEEAHFAGITRTDYEPHEIEERIVLAMINEAADVLHQGIARSASDIDLVSVHRLGFPRWRGGLMHYADTLGVAEIVARLQGLAEEDPVAWRLSPLLKQCAESGTRLADWTSN